MLLGFAARYVNAQNPPQEELKKLSLEDLMDINVTAVSRNATPILRTAAAITVLTAEDIRRSGVTNIPELLRLVPGLNVARQNAGSWGISARGFNSVAADKMLVLIDGRTVYSPLFSGTFWETLDLVLDDIERIEVVRGPGATLWGANAVNGIINIVMKSAFQTKGTYAVLRGGGAYDLASAAARYGGSLRQDTNYRLSAKYSYRDQMKFANGTDAQDSTRFGRLGFRVDRARTADDITVEGDFYNGLAGFPGRQDSKLFGGSVQGRLVHRFSNSELQVQTYFQRDYRRVSLQSEFFQRVFDVDVQHRIPVGSHHRFTWGAEYRWNADETRPTAVLSFVPAERTYPMVTSFVQDEISLAANRVEIDVGSKFEHNDFSGFEIQPSVRANWLIEENQAVWASVSRAVRTPTRFDSDIRFSPPGLTIFGNPDFKAEALVAYEAGYRASPNRRFSLDIATFINVYDRLRSVEFRPSNRALELNNLNARTYGGEVEGNFDATSWLRLRTNYSYLFKRLTTESGTVDLFAGTLEGNDPRNQFLVQALTNLPGRLEWDTTLRFVGSLPAPVVPHYTELDSRLGWDPIPGLEVSLIGRNLLDRAHPEFGPPSPFREEVERNIYVRLAFRF
jgi:iron complex outermembrane recepter protein